MIEAKGHFAWAAEQSQTLDILQDTWTQANMQGMQSVVTMTAYPNLAKCASRITERGFLAPKKIISASTKPHPVSSSSLIR